MHSKQNIFNKLAFAVLMILMFFGFTTQNVYAANTVYTASNGAIYTWNGKNTLTITGSGTIDSSWKTCSNFSGLDVINKLTTLTINGDKTPGIIKIGDYAFSDCPKLAKVNIETNSVNTITSIGNYAFYNCSSLSNFKGGNTGKRFCIPKNVTSIGAYAFKNCSTAVNTINIDSTNDTQNINIGTQAFYGYPNLKSLNLGSDKTTPAIITLSKDSFDGGSVSLTVTVRSKNIKDNGAFAGKSYLTTITFPNFTNVIPSNICEDCTGLTTVSSLGNTTGVGASAFEGCTSLTKVGGTNNAIIIPNTTTNIGSNAFKDTKVQSLTINTIAATENVTIGSKAFGNCALLKTITLGTAKTGSKNITLSKDTFTECNAAGMTVTVNSLNLADNGAFAGKTNLTSITFPYYTGVIPANICKDCTGLTTVSSLGNATGIGNSAFKGCTSLTKVGGTNNTITIPKTVIDIGEMAFESAKVNTVNITGTGTINVKRRAFANITTLTKKTLGGSGANVILDPEAFVNSTIVSNGSKYETYKKEEIKKAEESYHIYQTNLPGWDGTTFDGSCFNEGANTYNVTTPAQLAYALKNVKKNGIININKDINMHGGNITNTNWENVTFNGNNHTIYNIRGNCRGICNKYNGTETLRDITFKNAFFQTGSSGVGLMGKSNHGPMLWEKDAGDVYCYENKVYITNVKVEDSYFRCTSESDNRGFVGVFAGTGMGIVKNSEAKRCVTIGKDHVGGVWGLYNTSIFIDVKATDGVVINTGYHAGGFVGCSNTTGYFKNCYVNNICYGTDKMGGFASGHQYEQNVTKAKLEECAAAENIPGFGVFENCVSAGIVLAESNCGGFLGEANCGSVHGMTLKNCYSTAMVGMNYNSTNMGGFVGGLADNNISFINCYAAGEVGSIDIDPETTNNCGGFIGNMNSKTITMNNCYYDMQTTAMKNKAVGGQLYNLTRTPDGVKTTDPTGLTGVTTGILTSQKLLGNGYEYFNGEYPQIKEIANKSDDWKAYSAASVATVFCDDWHDIINTTAFDTVRDIMRPIAFSSHAEFKINPRLNIAQISNSNVDDISWSMDADRNELYESSGKSLVYTNKNIIDINTAGEAGSIPYYSINMYPGISWVKVETIKNGKKGYRNLRIIPTSVIEAGEDKIINVYTDSSKSDKYDHRIGTESTYIEKNILKRLTLLENIQSSSYFKRTYSDVDSITSNENIINGDLDLSFNNNEKSPQFKTVIANINGQKPVINNLYNKLVGNSKFDLNDTGSYELTYQLILSDGRYIEDKKTLHIISPYAVIYKYNYDGRIGTKLIDPETIFYVQDDLSGTYSSCGFNLYKYNKEGLEPEREGYFFQYWSLDKAGDNKIDNLWFKNQTITGNIVLYAQWDFEPPRFTVDKETLYEVTRGRAGTGTAALIKDGATDDYLPILSLKGGDTTEIVPDEGYCNIFKNEDHIAKVQAIYNDVAGGLTATLGGGKTEILGVSDDPGHTWYTGNKHLDFKTSDGKDAFIEFCKTTIELKEADNVQDGIKPSIVPAIRLDYNNGEDPDWHNDLVFYTNDAQELSIPEDEDFVGWNTKYNGKGDWYGSEEHNGVRTAKKVNITIQDADDISESQNTNIGILYAIYVKESYLHSNHGQE